MPMQEDTKHMIEHGNIGYSRVGYHPHVPTAADIAASLALLEDGLAKAAEHLPLVVSVSRSVRDGYTPAQVSGQIEAGVVGAVDRLFAGRGGVVWTHHHQLLGGRDGWRAGRHDDEL